MVFQTYSLYPWLSVTDNVASGMRLAGANTSVTSRTHGAYFLKWWVCRIQPADFPRQALRRHASSGWRLPGALAADPKLMLLDEPFGALSYKIRESSMQAISLPIVGTLWAHGLLIHPRTWKKALADGPRSVQRSLAPGAGPGSYAPWRPHLIAATSVRCGWSGFLELREDLAGCCGGSGISNQQCAAADPWRSTTGSSSSALKTR